MGIVVPVKDGKVVDETGSANSLSQVTKSAFGSADEVSGSTGTDI